MKNLIENARLCPGENGSPRGFSGIGPTYDGCCINGYHTCSLTMPEGTGLVANTAYDPAICVCGRQVLRWGFCIRAIEAQNILLVANFYDKTGQLIQRVKQPIAHCVSYRFSRQMACFPIPKRAAAAKLSIELYGKITACTYYAPCAYFC